MKRFGVIIAALTLFCMSCTAKNYHYVNIRSMATKPVIYEYWLSGVAFELFPEQEIEVIVLSDELRILTPWGLASGEIYKANTLELSEDGYYWGEEFHKY